jgi:hypothetical protein
LLDLLGTRSFSYPFSYRFPSYVLEVPSRSLRKETTMKGLWRFSGIQGGKIILSVVVFLALLGPFSARVANAQTGTFGYATTGTQSVNPTNVGYTSTATSNNSGNYLVVDQFQTTVPLTTVTIKTYGTVSGTVKVSIYNDSSNYPGTLRFTEVASSVTASAWSTITVPNTYLPAGSYWLAFNQNSSSGSANFITKNTGVTGAVRMYQALTYATAFPTSPLSTSWTAGQAGTQDCIYFVGVPAIQGYVKAIAAQAPSNGKMSSMCLYSHVAGTFSLALYTGTSSAPSARVWYSGDTSATASSWNCVAVSSGTPSSYSLTSGSWYWLAWQWNSSTPGPSYTTGSSGIGYYTAQSYGAFPSTWSGGTPSVEEWSIFVGYSPTAVRDTVVRVEHDAVGNLVQWRTSYEVRNLGFNVYREEPWGLERLNPSPIAGSALTAGLNTKMMAGNTYRWWDPDGSGAVAYWVESIDLSGEREMHGPARRDSPPEGQLLIREDKQLIREDKQSSPLLNRIPANSFSITSSYPGKALPLAAATTTASQQNLQWGIASGPAVKIGVRAEGWYVIPQSDLLAAGLSPSANPDFLHLYADGIELPMLLIQGTSKKSFDGIAFYGTGLDTPSTDTHIYWLTVSRVPGLRITTETSQISGGSPPASFPYTVVRRDKVTYFAALATPEGADNFFGPVIGSDPVSETLPVHHSVSGDITPTLQVTVQGVGDGPHTVDVQFNGSDLGAISFSGQAQGQGSFSLSPGALMEGDNTFTLASLDGSDDLSLLDTVSITYAHSYVMDGPQQRFTAPPGPLTITSTSSQVWFFDVSDPTDVRMITAQNSSAGSSYSYRLNVPIGSECTIFAVEAPAGFQAPAAITPNRPSDWHESKNRGQLVIIGHGSLIDSAERLGTFRSSQGYLTAVVDVEDLYDEFSFGAKDPAALRSFLQLASSTWKTAPRFVLLLGDATFDPRNYLGIGGDIYDLVPTKLINTTFLKTASDDWFGDFSGTGVPSLAIGRLPARTPADADLLVSKIIGYEQGGGSDLGLDRVLFVADSSDDYDFQAEADSLIPLVPASMAIATVQSSDPAASSQVLSYIENGALIVDYMGHGSVEVWNGNLLSSQTALALNNGPILPFFIDMTCLNAFFQDLYTTSLGESLLLAPEGGAVAVWASSALTDPAPQAAMNRALLRAMFAGSRPTLGEAILKAKAAISDNDVRRSWILLGDPTIRIRRNTSLERRSSLTGHSFE